MAEVSSATSAPARGATQGESGPKVIKEKVGGKTVYRITTEFVIEGKIQKPNAFYVLQRQGVNYGWDKLNRSFVQAILESVKGPPF